MKRTQLVGHLVVSVQLIDEKPPQTRLVVDSVVAGLCVVEFDPFISVQHNITHHRYTPDTPQPVYTAVPKVLSRDLYPKIATHCTTREQDITTFF